MYVINFCDFVWALIVYSVIQFNLYLHFLKSKGMRAEAIKNAEAGRGGGRARELEVSV